MNFAPLTRARVAALVFALCCTVSCGGGGGGGSTSPPRTSNGGGGGSGESQAPFTLATSEETSFRVLVNGDGAPLAGAMVMINSVRQVAELDAGDDPALLGGETYFRGMSDENGQVQGTVRIPNRHLSLDVIVQARGYEGPYSVESIRSAAGAFAPSARISKTREELNSVTIDLLSQ